MSQPQAKATRRRPQKAIRRSRVGELLNGMSVRGRLHMLVAVFGVGITMVLAVAGYGLLAGRSSAGTANSRFNALALEQDAHDGWLTEDDQLNLSTALASLNVKSEQPAVNAAIAQIVRGRQQASRGLAQFSRQAPSPQLRADAERVRADLTHYDQLSARVIKDLHAGDLRAAIVGLRPTSTRCKQRSLAPGVRSSRRLTRAT
jgi:hypothetical protein